MKTLSPLLFCVLPFISFAQQKVFYNKLKEEIDSSDAFSYYEIAEKHADGITLVKRFSPSDSLIFQGFYSRFQEKGKPSIREGEHKYYRQNEVLHYSENYQDNQLQGERRTYYPGGQLKRVEVYEQDKFVKGECYNEDGSSRPFTRFEQKPSFPGGEQELFRYLSEKLTYPKFAREKEIQGQVVLLWLTRMEASVMSIWLKTLVEAAGLRLFAWFKQCQTGFRDISMISQ